MTDEYFDVVIVGAGLSGIGAAWHLQEKCPGKSYLILEGRESMGGTWDLFRYPGIRSDSDMFTLGYSFKPWRDGKAIADGPSILNYVEETSAESGIDEHIRYQHHVKDARWSGKRGCWTISAERKDTGESVDYPLRLSVDVLRLLQLRERLYARIRGRENFRGEIVHPQNWPDQSRLPGQESRCYWLRSHRCNADSGDG